MIDELYQVLRQRKQEAPPGSYTVELLRAGQPAILAKVEEEAQEVIRAARAEGSARLIEEVADLLYHLLVLLLSRGIELEEVWQELQARRPASGDGDKAGTP